VAWRVEADASERAIRVSSVQQPEEAIVTVSRSRRSDQLEGVLKQSGARQVVPMGSAGLKGALVAEGNADAYLSVGVSGKYWDACAMDAIVSGAGGIVSDLRGAPFDYRSGQLDLSHGVLAANPALHAGLQRRLGSA
jgi:3'(2'), 5'-bisphosphate nucleotidase